MPRSVSLDPYCPAVSKYVEGQQEHHRRVDFREELVRLLELHGIEYDERYLPA